MLFEVFTFQGGLVPYKAVQINFEVRVTSEAVRRLQIGSKSKIMSGTPRMLRTDAPDPAPRWKSPSARLHLSDVG